jgi:transcriptional regulator with XRE-family HTH domain
LKEKKTIKIGNVLERLRRKRLLSQEQLAELSNRDRRYISSLERDEYLPGFKTLVNLAIALDMKPSELMKEIEENAVLFLTSIEEDSE